MSPTATFYRLAYRVGFHPWEDLEQHPPFADRLSQLLDREESGRQPPFGAALDVGCGSGVWSVHLARRGWDVTAIDIVPRALERARRRVREAGVDVRLLHGDVTDLGAAGLGTGFRLVLTRAPSTASPTPSVRRWAVRSTRSSTAMRPFCSTCSPPAAAGRCPVAPAAARSRTPSRLEGDRRRGGRHRPRRDRPASEVRRALVPAPTRMTRPST